MKKVAIIGAGQVGATTAMRIAEKELADVVLVDILEGVPQGKALDLLQAAPILGHHAKIKGTNDYSEIAGSDIVVITAGLPRKPGMSRDDLLKKNFTIIESLAKEVKRYAPDAIVIVITNPLDIMAYTTLKITGFDKGKVIGMAGILDSTRFRSFIAQELNVSVRDVDALVLGSHGDAMVPLPDYTTVAGIPITSLLSKDKIEALIERTRHAGAEIVSHLKTGSAFYAPAAAVTEMVEAIIKDSKRIVPCSVYVEGEYNYNGIFIGLPVKLGKAGVEEIIEIELDEKARKELDKSADVIKENISKLKL